MAVDNDIIADLPDLTWRGLRAPPYEVVTFEFDNELASRGVPYADAEVHDYTGRHSFPTTCRLFFLNTLGDGRLFPDLWNQWAVNLDGEPGDLVHPVLGPMKARVKNAKGEIRATVRAGVIVDVTWVETNLNPGLKLAGFDLFADPSTIAAQADTNWSFKGRTYPAQLTAFITALKPPAPGTTPTVSLLEAYLALRSLLFAANLAALNLLRKLQGIVAGMVDTVAVLTDPTEWATLDLLTSFWDLLGTQALRIERATRATARKVVRFDTTLEAFAAEVGNALTDIMGLNLAALRSPIVLRGTTLTYFA